MNNIDIDNTLFQIINDVSKDIKKNYYNELEKNNISLPIEQLNVLMYINNNKNVKQQDIADATGKDKTTITRFLETMIKKKLILKKSSKIDTRQKLISISKNGLEILNKSLDVTFQFNKNLEKNFDKKDLVFLKKQLKSTSSLMDQESLF
jgi:DNA-binding MarR family transcriptional regulator